MPDKRPWFRLLPLLGMMAAIFTLSHQPGDSLTLPDIINIDKLLHALVYTLLGLTAWYAMPPPWRQIHPKTAAVLVVACCLLYGITDEWHQSFIPGRFSSAADVGADAFGGGLAVLAVNILRRRPAVRTNQ